MENTEQNKVINNYIRSIQGINPEDASEHTYRTPFENLLRDIQFDGLDIMPIHEGKSQSTNIDGVPDFIIYKDNKTFFKSLVGFIECKRIDYDLEKVKNSPQIDKYSNTSENILITNYREFILLNKGKEVNKVILLDNNFTKSKDENAHQQFINLLRDFYNYEYQYIKDKKTLAKSLAAQSFYYSVALRTFIEDETQKNKPFYKKFYGLLKSFQDSIQYYYQLEDFCDIYAQSLVYGLFLARLDTNELLKEGSAKFIEYIPVHFNLLIEFLSAGFGLSFRDLPSHISHALVNISKNINFIDIPKIQTEFGFDTSCRNDISVYLYEDFLREYDKLKGTENRKESGVYYTPKEVAIFITRAVNDIIISDFSMPNGFMSENVKFLDFACGTGTFIQSIFDIIFNKIYTNNLDDLERKKVKRKVLNDIYGFELLYTPYIVAHTILTNYLKTKKINFNEEDRLKIFLTNTLDIEQHSISVFLPVMQEEHQKSYLIKSEENILAIVGNPPYFHGKSKAIPGLIDKELSVYKNDLNEKNIRPISDMYIKFIRFAEWKMEQTGQGIVGIITNNSFLDGVTHRQMRKHLYETYDEIYILNLHGNSRKGEKDKNIFDIMVGVSINIFVKHKEPKKEKIVKYFSTLDNKILKRNEKIDFLKIKKLSNVKWKTLHPEESDYYWFVTKNYKYEKKHEKFWKINDIFEEYNSGIGTANDDVTIQYNQKLLNELKKDFEKLTIEQILIKYKIKEKEDWKLDNTKSDLINNYRPQKIYYRPLDYRFTSLSTNANSFLSRPRYEIMKHFENNNQNYGICFTRTTNANLFKNIFVTSQPTDGVLLGGRTYIAPLYIYNGNGGSEIENLDKPKRTNFTSKFKEEYLAKLNFNPTPEEIFAYIYAVMHSPIYREKYIEFLKIDFPAIPMTLNKEMFEQFSKLGTQLIDLHLLQNIPADNEIKVLGNFDNPCRITKIEPPKKGTHSDDSKLKLITSNIKDNLIIFENITADIYYFEIGSYKPVEKWLKYRIKDKIELSEDDFNYIKNMLISIKYTITIMQEIEKLEEGYFL